MTKLQKRNRAKNLEKYRWVPHLAAPIQEGYRTYLISTRSYCRSYCHSRRSQRCSRSRYRRTGTAG